MPVLLGVSAFWLATALFLHGAMVWRNRHPGGRTASELNASPAGSGLFLASYGLYGVLVLVLALAWAGYGLWRWLV